MARIVTKPILVVDYAKKVVGGRVFMAGRQVGPAARFDPSRQRACPLVPRITEILDLETCKGIDHFLMLVMVSLLLWVGNVVSRSFPSAESPYSDFTT